MNIYFESNAIQITIAKFADSHLISNVASWPIKMIVIL